jgi:pimeloyl-ACP methyl ester carboxylesterase
MKRRRLARASIALVAIYAIAISLIMGCGLTSRLLLYPQTGALPNTNGAVRFTVPSREGDIEIWRARSSDAEPKAFVLRFYGNADRADNWVGGEARGLPFAAELWGVNYPGFGGSSGSASLRGVAESALVAYDALKKQAGTRPILVFGTSMGTTAALHVAANREVKGLLLQNPPPLRQLIRGEYGWWNLWLLAVPIAWGVPSELDSLENAAKSHAPAVFVLSEQDEVVGHRYALRVRDAYAGPKQTLIVAGARHNDPIPEHTQRAIQHELLAMLGKK